MTMDNGMDADQVWEDLKLIDERDAAIWERDDYKACAENWEANANKWSDDWHELRDERDALAAHVERLSGILFDTFSAFEDGRDEEIPYDEYRDAYNEAPATSLACRDAEQQKVGAASFRHEVMESVKAPFRPHIQGVFDVWLRRQAESSQ